MRRTRIIAKLLALILGACLWAGPALATGFTVIPGIGQTGGAQRDFAYEGTLNNIPLHPTSTIPVGSLVLMPMQSLAGGCCVGGWTTADTQGNIWTSVGVEAESTTATQVMYSILAHSLATSDTVTSTLVSGSSSMVGSLFAFSADGTISFETGASNGGGFGDVSTLTMGPTSSGTCNGTTNCRLAICVGTARDSAALQKDAAYTNIANPGVNANDMVISWAAISSSTAGKSCTVTVSPATRLTGQLLIFDQSAGGGGPLKPILMRSTP